MSASRPNRGERIALLAALLLFAATFLEWYGLDREPANLHGALNLFDQGGNAWQALELAPILLTAASASTVGLVLLGAAGLRRDSPGSTAEVLSVLGGLTTLLVAAHIAFPPDSPHEAFSRTLGPGIYLSLLAAIGITVGGWLARRDEVARQGTRGRSGRPRGGAGISVVVRVF